MGVSGSSLDEDKALQLCRERKRYVRQALDGRCSLAGAHVTYIQSLRTIGTALWKFVEPEGAVESSLYTSTTATPEPLALTERSLSHFSFSSPSPSQRVDMNDNRSPTPSPPKSGQFQANYMKASVSSSTTVEEKPFPVTKSMRSSSNTPQNQTHRSLERSNTSHFEDPILPPEAPWDYFDVHPIDSQFSFQERRGFSHSLDSAEDIRRLREEEGIPDLEEEEEKVAFIREQETEESDDEFDEPDTDNLVRRFENRTVSDPCSTSETPSMPQETNAASETEGSGGEKSNSPELTHLITKDSVVTPLTHEEKMIEKEPDSPNKVAPKDFFSSIREIESLFIRASDSGKEVPRMLEANKLHFRPIFPGTEGRSKTSIFLKACFSCGEDPTQAPPEASTQTAMKYLTWHRTASSRSSSSRNPLGPSKEDVEDMSSNIFESFCMNSGSHASTLDRLYAWERKLCDEVKASGIIRRDYDMKCRLLRQQVSKDESANRIDKTRAVVKDLHSRIRVAIHRIDSISKRIEELRDKELQPQLEELIAGLSRMWKVMHECHKLQFKIIKVAYTRGSAKVPLESESHRQAAIHLGRELSTLSSSFTKWINAQKSYVQSIDGWLHKCVSVQQKSSRRKKKPLGNPLRSQGPPIYVTCGVWLDNLQAMRPREVADCVKELADHTSSFLARQEKNRRKNSNATLSSLWKTDNQSEGAALRDGSLEDWIAGLDSFRKYLVGFLGRLNSFASSSVEMYREIENAIEEAKKRERREEMHKSQS